MNAELLHRQLVATELLFESVTEPHHLRDALYAMTTLLDADVGALAIGRPGGGTRTLITTDSPEPSGSAQRNGLATLSFMEPYRRAVLARPSGCLYHNDDLLPRDQLEQTAFYRNFLQQAPLAGGCIGYTDGAGGEICTLGFGRFRLGETGERPDFDPEAMVAVERLFPHLRRVCQLHHRLDNLQAVSAAAMNRYERYHVGVVVVDEEGCVVFSNAAARAVFEQRNGLLLRGNYLDLASEPESESLMRAIRAAIDGDLPNSSFDAQLHPVSREGAAPLSIAISPYRHGNRGRGQAVLMIHDPDHPAVPRREAVQSAYQLNERESELACALSDGESLEGFAERSGRSLESVRSQLKRIYRKTGTSRQTELVKLVLSGPAAMVQ